MNRTSIFLATTVCSGSTLRFTRLFLRWPTNSAISGSGRRSISGSECKCRHKTFNPPIKINSNCIVMSVVPTLSRIYSPLYYRNLSSRSRSSNSQEQLTEEEQKVLVELEKEEALFMENQRLIKSRPHNKHGDDASFKLQESISEAYVPFENQQKIIQDVIDELWNPAAPQPENQLVYQAPPEFLQRGKTGVFDISELVDLLRNENCEEMLTISIPKEIDYADHMIIVTCRGPRHLLAVATYVRKRYKIKTLMRTDTIPAVVAKDGAQGWIALDLGNIVLHLFLQQQRDKYDLEMLWTVGPLFDDLSNTQDTDIIQLLNMIK